MKTRLFLSVAALVVANDSAATDESKTSAGAEHSAKRLRDNIASELKALPDHPWAPEQTVHWCAVNISPNPDI